MKQAPILTRRKLVLAWVQGIVLCGLLCLLVVNQPYVTWIQLGLCAGVLWNGFKLIEHYQTVRAINRYLDAQETK